jgi:hypothetical protein
MNDQYRSMYCTAQLLGPGTYHCCRRDTNDHFPCLYYSRNDLQYNIATPVDQLRALVFSTMPTAGRELTGSTLRPVHMCRWKVETAPQNGLNNLVAFCVIIRNEQLPGRARVCCTTGAHCFQGATIKQRTNSVQTKARIEQPAVS